MRESVNRTLPLGVTTLSDSITTCLLPGRLLPEAVTVKDADRTTGGKDMADRAAVCVRPLQQGRDWSEPTEAEDARCTVFFFPYDPICHIVVRPVDSRVSKFSLEQTPR